MSIQFILSAALMGLLLALCWRAFLAWLSTEIEDDPEPDGWRLDDEVRP